MKIRNGFVSNSSSSSFIVIGNNISYGLIEDIKIILANEYNNTTTCLSIGNIGTTEFGWDNIRYNTFWDRLNFTTIQIMYLNDDYENTQEYKMLEKILKQYLNVDTIVNKLSLDYDCRRSEFYSYIDHKSCITEEQNDEMLENEDSLTKFLFSDVSYIQSGSNNE